ncbi:MULTISPECIES: arsenate reductase ArsC [unclassified Hydrogenophaga]|uniref:arsenate reductase ArsC n=1 Tax=unclassified Hydrogenophaga TaxID=2610897 RepID=UPI00095FFA42|nr:MULTISPECIES: arsenate reductase ArsC [unclassified Hydrogenophaga]MBN9373533.1 arsenate reductase ArsC [Hydrogenophaga sp.]OJV62823.1 MAG: protein-tyrosine-phosphatase [Hydrogenophaga sp. 70-12]
MENRPYNVLFICTGNSARSLMAEAVLNQLGQGRFRAFSAGSQPAGRPHPMALELLQRNRYDTSALRSKSWDEFAQPGAPEMDFVLTVCDKAAGEVCPLWPGQPISAHWGVEDPAAATGPEDKRRQAFNDALLVLSRRIAIFLALPLDKLDRLALQRELGRIGLSGKPAGAAA